MENIFFTMFSITLTLLISLIYQYKNTNSTITKIANHLAAEIRDDVLSGRYSRVFHQCKLLENMPGFHAIKIIAGNETVCALGRIDSNELTGISVHRDILFDELMNGTAENVAGNIVISFNIQFLWTSLLELTVISFILMVSVYFGFSMTMNETEVKIVSRLMALEKSFSSGLSETSCVNDFVEIQNVITAYNNLLNKVDEQKNEIQWKTQSAVIGDIARQVAHDIRSPLTAFELALVDIEISEDRKLTLKGASDRIKHIANELLAKAAESRKSVEPSIKPEETIGKVSLTKTLNAIVKEKRILAKMVKFHIDTGDEIFVHGDPGHLGRVLSNLIDNSMDATNELTTPEISINAATFGKYAAVFIKDNGPGIPSDILDNIGVPGFTFGKVAGNGLGFSAAKNALKNWGGDLQIISKVGEGTMVTLKMIRT